MDRKSGSKCSDTYNTFGNTDAYKNKADMNKTVK